MRFHLERRTGAMGQIAEQGIGACEQLLHQTIFTLLQVTLQFASVAIVLLHFGYPFYFLILAAAAVGYIVAYERGARDVQEPAHAMSAARINAQAEMTDNLLNAEAIKCYDAERVVSLRYDSSLANVESAWHAFARQRLVTGVSVGTVFALSIGASLVYAAHGVAKGTMTIGDFVLVNSYILQFVTPLEQLGFALREIVRALANLQGLLGVLGEKTEGDLTPARERLAGNHCGELAFRNVTFSYRPSQTILSNISFQVPAGRTLAVVGVSGSGKSSLIRLLFRLYEPGSGEIVLDGVPISRLALSTVRQAIAVVPQDTVLFHDTIAANIAFGRHGASQAEIEEAARIANLHDFVCRQPAGYQTIVGERGLKLSGGERQRVAIARAALKRPRIFVFDEATSSLDSRTEREILRNLDEVSSHSTTLVIAHRLSTVVHADEILVLHEGSIVERGPHADLLALNGQYAALWRAQQSTGLRRERQELNT
jgi:ATP-binding cassette subfamily B protein